MEATIVLAAIGVLIACTVVYKQLPHRETGPRKPIFAFFPKYKKRVKHTLNAQQLEEKLADFGFKKTGGEGELMAFSRGAVLGDISVKLSKVAVGLEKITDNEHEMTVHAGWVRAFDTGDHWQFITELSERIEKA